VSTHNESSRSWLELPSRTMIRARQWFLARYDQDHFPQCNLGAALDQGRKGAGRSTKTTGLPLLSFSKDQSGKHQVFWMRVVFFIGLKQSSHRHQRTSCYQSWMCEGIDCSILELSTQIRDSRPATLEDQTTHQYPSARHWTTLTWTYSTNDQKQRLKKYLCC